jgi:hypothetical protein
LFGILEGRTDKRTDKRTSKREQGNKEEISRRNETKHSNLEELKYCIKRLF